MGDKSVFQGETVAYQAPVGNGSSVPEIPPPGDTTPVGFSGFGDGESVDFQQLLMWIANMASEYIKQQSELLKTRQKAIESGYDASITAANQNFDKNMTQAIIGIVGSSVALGGAGIAGFKLGAAGKELKNLSGTSKVAGTGVDVKKQEALSQLISKTAESISSNEGSSRQIIEKFANELIAMLKNFYASTTR